MTIMNGVRSLLASIGEENNSNTLINRRQKHLTSAKHLKAGPRQHRHDLYTSGPAFANAGDQWTNSAGSVLSPRRALVKSAAVIGVSMTAKG
jgi:hypothetical protein